MINKLKQLLIPLYEDLVKVNINNTCETFCAQWGESYQEGGIMFVGRAVNDWKPQGCRDVKTMFTIGTEEQIYMREDQMRWVEDIRYYSRSAFWRVVKDISQQITNDKEGWYKHIVWSNLYKQSPTGGKKNPNYTSRQSQFRICLEILKTELEIFKPKFVVLLNGSEWYNDFLWCLNEDKELDILESKFWEGRENTKYKIDICKIGDIYFIGSVHPQGKKEKKHADVIVEIIKNQTSNI